jgi:hypothetical protein
LDEILQERNKINTLLGDNISGSTTAWGLEVQRFEMKDVAHADDFGSGRREQQHHGIDDSFGFRVVGA